MIMIDMDKPKYCAVCPCLDHENGKCQAIEEYTTIQNWYAEPRPSFCPIKEVVECPECKWGFCNEIPNGESYMNFYECDLIKGVVPVNGYCVFGARKVVQND